jgi:hypothetical protein
MLVKRTDATIEVLSENMPESLSDKIAQRVIESLPGDLDLFLSGKATVTISVTPNGRESGI